LTGFFSYYTAQLIIIHLGKAKNIKECILAHFEDDRFMVGYSFFIWISFIPMLVSYFRIICLQIIGLLGYDAAWIAPGVAGFLIVVVVMIRRYQIGEEVLAFGIVSIVTYVMFLIWAQVTAPTGPKSVPESGYPYFLAASLVGAY
jgi:hypothetical protein